MRQKKLFSISTLSLSVFLLIYLLNVLPSQPLYGDESDFIKEYKSAEVYFFLSQISYQKGELSNADIMGREFAGGVKRFTLNVGEENTPFFMNAYVVFNPEMKDAVLIDPGMNDQRIDTFIESRNLNLLAILNTHGHQDHIGANSYFAKKYGVEIYSHAADKHLYEINDRSQNPNKFFTKEDSLLFQKLTVKVIHTPGHSQGSCSFLINEALFSGDCLFK